MCSQDPSGDVRLDPTLLAIIDATFARCVSVCVCCVCVSLIHASRSASWEGLQAKLTDPTRNFSLSHGDFHASNALLMNSALSGTHAHSPCSAL